ncbi:hypothetical protein ABFG93_08100 [Pseudalkalibacillus hwajinpoensis]|uniref:hypothetical protein n=1 Tax=Guptibacillus hwajinpoensis TaxID=208199 RepID=UPI00325AB880
MNLSISLEMIRKTEGIKRLENYVRDLIQLDRKHTALRLQEEELTYSTLYILSSILQKHGMTKHLEDRYKVALAIQRDILSSERSPATPFPYSICDMPQFIHSVLRWMVESGSEDNLNAKYRLVIDRAAGLLTTVYQDPEDLTLVSDLLFRRRKLGHSTHYLTWAYFSSRNLSSLIPIAKRLISTDESDVQLASELLHFVSGIEESEDRYSYFRSWYAENLPYLLQNKNNYELTAELKPYIVDHHAKYMEDQPDSLKRRSDNFHSLHEDVKEKLANYSYQLRMHSRKDWKVWMNSPLETQVRSIEEGQHDYNRR